MNVYVECQTQLDEAGVFAHTYIINRAPLKITPALILSGLPAGLNITLIDYNIIPIAIILYDFCGVMQILKV